MPKTNKKTKIAAKATKNKKMLKKTATSRKTAKNVRGEGIIGSVAPSQSEVLGTRIPVQEIKAAPLQSFDDFYFTQEDLALENNLLNSPEPINDNQNEQIVPQYQEDIQPEDQDSAEEYYVQKELSPSQKNIIMWVSISAIMGVLVFFWGLSIKNSMSQGLTAGFGDQSGQLLNEFQGTFDDLQSGLTNATNQEPTAVTNQAIDNLKQQLTTTKVKDDIANQLKNKLENLNANNNVNTNANIANLNNN